LQTVTSNISKYVANLPLLFLDLWSYQAPSYWNRKFSSFTRSVGFHFLMTVSSADSSSWEEVLF